MIPLLIALAIALGAGGTIAVSDDARPGDILFPVDTAVERVQIAFSNDKNKSKLKAAFANERLEEVKELIDEDADDQMNDSTESDDPRDKMDDSKKENIEDGLSFAIDLLSEIDEENGYGDLMDKLNTLIADFPEDTELDVKLSDKGSSFIRLRSDDDSNRFDFEIKETGDGERTIIKTRDGESRVEVEIRSDEVKVEIKTDNSGSDDNDDDKDEMNEVDDDKGEVDEADDDKDEMDEVDDDKDEVDTDSSGSSSDDKDDTSSNSGSGSGI